LTSLSGISYNTIQSRTNPTTTPQDKTNTQLKSIGASYDIFSTQTEGNRGYNLLNTQGEHEEYSKNKSYAKYELSCEKRLINREIFNKHFQVLCLKGQRKPEGGDDSCKTNSDGVKEGSNCETIEQFTTRRRGGASPINLDFSKIGSGIYELKNFTGMQAQKEIFDIGGSQAIKTAELSANSYKAYKTYASPTAMQTITYMEYKDIKSPYQVTALKPDNQISFNNVDYFSIYNNGKDTNNLPRNSTRNNNTFKLSRNRSCKNCIINKIHTYKVIPSTVKNTSIIPDQLNGINTTKFGESSPLYNYYQMIIGKIEEVTENIS
jgi:hypothetical protein